MALEDYLPLPERASAHAAELDHMLGMVHWLMIALGLFWGVFFIYCLVRFNKGANPKADYHGLRSHFSTYGEIAVAFIEIILLLGFSIPFWSSQVVESPKVTKDAIVVRVVAQQFAWNIHYPGADGQFGRTDAKFMDAQMNPIGIDPEDPIGKDDVFTVGELALPVDKKVVIRLSSKDVIHSFSLPVMRVKKDAIPGLEIPIAFQPIKTGQWEIACAQLCGNGHYIMKGQLLIQTAEEFEKWLAEKAAARQQQVSVLMK